MRRRSTLAGALALLAGLWAAAPAAGELRLAPVGEFDQPVAVTGAPGDSERIYVVEQRGTVQVVRGGEASLFADLRAAVRGPGDVDPGYEEGLLSIAFAPDFPTSRLLYAYYTAAPAGDEIVVEELRAPTGDAIDPGWRRPVLAIPHPFATNHNGGTIAFGPDGLLYLAPGDGGDNGTGGALATDMSSLLGKLLRIDPRGAAPGEYGVPPDNPFVGVDGARPEIWASGLRNPFRFAFDSATGDLAVADVGEGTTEEITLLRAATGRGRGADLGWNACEGAFATGSREDPCPRPGALLPQVEQLRDDGWRSIVTGPVVRDPSLPSLAGRLIYGDYFVDTPRSVAVTDGGVAGDRPEPLSLPGLTAFGEDAGGCLYAVSRDGPVHRIVEGPDESVPCPAPAADPPGPPAPPPAGPPPSGSPPGTDPRPDGPPRLAVAVRRRQPVLRRGRVLARVRCSRACRLSAR
ncbi:MAG: PQQ-dependent sugar dehydrogenase, partial [Solirubrobacterales bacterium]|nr:PQQ-dependent sugar dehydrogenase [Solirubrobacterales bacterium]